MTKDIQHVRKSIKRRKKIRELHQSTNNIHQLPLIQEEEKHGYISSMPYPMNYKVKNRRNKRGMKSAMTLKAIVSLLLFFSTAFILSSNHQTLESSKLWLTGQLEEEFPFAKVQGWYVSTLGSPLSIAPQGNHSFETEETSFILPVMGQVVETFHDNGTGIMISPADKSTVTSLDEGIVIFAGKDNHTKKTIIIQHADGSNTTYGLLSDIDVHLYQFVQPKQKIGTFTPTEESEVVYFSIEKNNTFIDPSQVIPVDNIP